VRADPEVRRIYLDPTDAALLSVENIHTVYGLTRR
jgi:hypothetical protein